MSPVRSATAIVAGLRLLYGLALAIAPGSVGSKWIGGDAHRPATAVALRALGVRDIALQAGAAAAAVRGQPVRPWLLASLVSDVTDVITTAGASDDVPDDAPKKTFAVAGGSAVVSGVLLAAVDD